MTYFDFHRYNAFWLMMWRRQSSAVATPASDSLRIERICSSLNQLLRRTPPRRLPPAVARRPHPLPIETSQNYATSLRPLYR